MIINFADKRTETFYSSGKGRLPENIQRKALMLLQILDAAEDIKDMASPPGNRLHTLSGNLAGYYSVSINMQFRIIFRFENGNAYDVKIADYH